MNNFENKNLNTQNKQTNQVENIDNAFSDFINNFNEPLKLRGVFIPDMGIKDFFPLVLNLCKNETIISFFKSDKFWGKENLFK